MGSRGVRAYPYDPQDAAATAECSHCGGEIYGDAEPDEFGAVLCGVCRRRIEGNEVLIEYAEAYPKRLLDFLEEQKIEDDMAPFFKSLREAFVGDYKGMPDLERWART